MSRRAPLRTSTRARALKGKVRGSITCVSALQRTVKQQARALHQVARADGCTPAALANSRATSSGSRVRCMVLCRTRELAVACSV